MFLLDVLLKVWRYADFQIVLTIVSNIFLWYENDLNALSNLG